MERSHPAYRHVDWAPAPVFDCQRLRATLSPEACGERWQRALPGSACHGCEVGKFHAGGAAAQAQAESVFCYRCGRSDLRVIVSSALCISCHNRQLEWRRGANAKGQSPALFVAPFDRLAAIQLVDGALERRPMQSQHDQEALRRALADLPAGARISAPQRQRTAWNPKIGAFEVACPVCSATGLVLERMRGGVLEHHCWSCQGDPEGPGWRFDTPRAGLLPMRPETAAAWLGALDGDAVAVTGWADSGIACACCGRGQLEARFENGRWITRCPHCGSKS
ncbi:MAG: hypothetical protein AB7S55_09435 [Thiomonas sp.]